MVAIHTLRDVGKCTLANVTGQLKVAEEELDGPLTMVNHGDKLYLSEEVWEEKMEVV
jgi:hypothetical protein